MTPTHVAIVGAGPIGLELAVALKHAGVSYIQFDAGQIGQTISWYPTQVRFFSSPERIAIAGVPLQTVDQSKATREEYLAYLRGVVEHFDLDVHTYEKVEAIHRDDDGTFLLRTTRAGEDHTYSAKAVVIAVGDMAYPRLLHVPGEDLPHVAHYFKDPHAYFRKKLLIVGGRNSAVEAALRCYRAGAQVAMSYRHPAFDEKSIKYWLLPEVNFLIKGGKIGWHPGTTPTAITPTHVTLAATGGGAATTVDADFVLLLTGYVADTSLFEMLGVELAGPNRAPVSNEATMETSVPGLFVAGTAAAGTQQRFKLFIENCHAHVQRIVRAITGRDVTGINDREYAQPES